MAVRINLRKTDKPVLSSDSGLGGDRMAALANMEGAPPVPTVAVPPVSADGAVAAPADGSAPVADAAPSAPPPDMAASAVALRMVHAAAVETPTPLPVAAAAAPAVDGEPTEEVASEALLQHSSKPAAMRAFGTIFKWGFIAAVLLGGILYLMRDVLFPVVQELRKPKTGPVAVDKKASSLVQAVQQARVTVSKNDARVDYIHEIMGEKEKPKPEVEAPKPPEPPVTMRPALPKDGTRFRVAVDRLNISAVMDGTPPRLFIDGLIVKVGDLVDRQVGLRFTGVDAAAHVVLFTNKEGEVFRRPY